MKFSVPAGNRKWVCRRIAIVLCVAMAWLAGAPPLFAAGAAAAAAPLPRPRPPGAAMGPPPSEAATPLAASACRLALSEAVALASDVAPVSGPGECGGDDLVRLEAVVLPDRRRVALRPAATLRCEMAAAVAAWVRDEAAALVERHGARLAGIEVADSFSCRGRNRVEGAKLSEHGRANAIDIRALLLEGRPALPLPARATPRGLREPLRASLCARFTTVLGPGSDGYHEDHIHLDLRQRSNGYRICQWTIEDDEVVPQAGAGVAAATTDPAPQARPEAGAGPETEVKPKPKPDPAQVAALPPAVPLPRPRPVAAPAGAAVTAPPLARTAKSGKKPARRAARRSPAPPWPFSLLTRR